MGKKQLKKMNIYELILSFRNNLGDYHHHKEQMAFRIAVLYFLGATALVVKGNAVWYGFSSIEKCFIAVVFALSGVGAFLYVIWQLKNRRYAADMVTACTNLASKWLTSPPDDKDMVSIKLVGERRVHPESQLPRALTEEFTRILNGERLFGGSKPSEWLTYIIMFIWGVAAIVRVW